MESSAPTSSALESLQPRPPTPPRDNPRESHLSLKGVLRRTPSDQATTLQTPPNGHTPRSAGATNPSSSRLRKRVEWSSHTEYKDPPSYRDGSRLHFSSPLSAPSSASSRPVKGILKPSPSPNPLASSLSSELDGLAVQVPIIEMLESTIKQLAGSDRHSRLDAYMVLSRTLKASNNLPDRVALQNKMGLFMQFIQRDILSKNEQGNPDSTLINHALQLLITFLHFQAIASTLTSDFGVFIIDHCIRCFGNSSTPKETVRYLLQVVAFQSFSAKVMTSERVGRLVASLHNIEEHVSGKSIVMSRIHIYKRLIKQSRNHMTIHTDWLKDMFTDMLSSVKEIQTQAISLGSEAGFSLRNEKHLQRKAIEILQTTEDQSYIEYFIDRLEEMIKGKQRSSAVPQIWAVVILFLRCPLDRWQYFGPWLKLVQSAFNTTDPQTKQEANYAWNRYVYLSIIDSKVMPKPMLTLLTQPMISQLRRKFNAKQVKEGKELRKVVIGGICNLCYYTLRPTHDKTSIDIAWDIVVQPVMAQLISLEGKPEAYGDSMRQASRILSGLFDVSTPRGWKEERVRDMPSISPEELPSIDPKWIRRNSDKIFQVVSPILEAKVIDLSNKESAAYRLWQTLVGSVAAASAKDIKVSDDTAKFLSNTFGLLSKLWSTGCLGADQAHVQKFLSSIQNLIGVLVSSLGLLPFTEKKFAMSIENTFEPTSTPSNRPDRANQSFGVVRPPVHHLFSMLCSIPPGAGDDDALAEFIRSVFEPFFEDKPLKARIDLSREMLRLIPRNTLSPYGAWILAVQNLRMPLEQSQAVLATHPSSSERLLGPEYREIVSLLERGLVSHPNLPSQHWFSLFNLLSNHVAQELGDAGRALGIVEPLAKIVLDNFFSNSTKPTDTAFSVTTTLFQIAKLPRDRQAVEVARRRLWGAPPTVSRASSFDPFDNLYKLGCQALIYLYTNMADMGDRTLTSLCIDSISAFATASFSQVGIKTLLKLVEGISPWIQDEKAQLKLGDQSPVSITIYGLFNSITEQLISLGHLDKSSFAQIEPLLTAGFKSKHRYIVNKTAEAWNAIVKDEEELECSDSLKSLVAALRPKVDLALPGVEESSGEFGAQAMSFIDSQDDLSFVALSSAKSSKQEVPQPAPPTLSLSKVAAKGPMTRKRRREATPEVVQTRSAKRTITPRLRHDNSQIQFAPIESSPLVEESQHLTERQKEVRQRQRDNSHLYPGIRSSPRTRSQGPVIEEPEEPVEPVEPVETVESKKTKEPEPEPELVAAAEAPTNGAERLQTTPQRTTSYEDFITSTPTPRRGQALHLLDDNDPPSSPPEPRRYPLLSEIQTRSKSRTTLESWEFSSPPGTPTTSRQQDAHAPELPHITLTEDSTQHKVDEEADVDVAGEVDEQPEEDDAEMKVIPSSIIIGGDADVEQTTEGFGPDDDTSSELSAVPSDPPLTPPPHESSEMIEAEGTPKSGEDEFVDARSSPLQPSSPAAVPAVDQEMVSTPNKETSFYLSEGDESSMMRFVVELESRRCALPIDKLDSVSPEKREVKGPVKECITVSSPSEKEKNSKKRSPSPIIPSTPMDLVEEERSQSPTQTESQSQTSGAEGQSQGEKQTRKKRKRSAKYSETRRKKRRSVCSTDGSRVELTAEPVEDSQPVVSESSTSDVPSQRRSPRRTPRLRSKAKQDALSQSPSQEENIPPPAAQPVLDDKSKEKRDGGDTDEEVMSQLLNESFAASHNQSQQETGEQASGEVEDSMDLIQSSEEQPRIAHNTRGGRLRSRKKESNSSKADTIMQMLRAGLNELRGAALSREEVYKLEDVIMDVRKELFEAERRGRA